MIDRKSALIIISVILDYKVYFHVFVDRPHAKLVEGDFPTGVAIYFIPLPDWVFHIDAPFLKKISGLHEL
jgi:hypothetical protein